MNGFESFAHKEEHHEPQPQNEEKSGFEKDTKHLQELFAQDRKHAAEELEKRKKMLREKIEAIRKKKLLEDLSKKSKH